MDVQRWALAHQPLHVLEVVSAVLRFCAACGRSLTARDRFCGECGAPTRQTLRAVQAHGVAEASRARRSSSAIATIYGGTLLALLLVGSLVDANAAAQHVALLTGEILAGVAAALVLGSRSYRASFGRTPRGPHLALAVPCAAITLTLAAAWVTLFTPSLPGNHVEQPGVNLLVVELLLTVICTPLVEEWLCRGLLWIAVRPNASRTTTLWVTATLFALLHGLNGGYLLEVPHRLAAGLLFGVLRDRSGSLWPSVLAHMLHNGGAMLL